MPIQGEVGAVLQKQGYSLSFRTVDGKIKKAYNSYRGLKLIAL